MADFHRLEPQADWYGNQKLLDRKIWYSTVAETYNRVRPRYPQTLIEFAIAKADLPNPGRILEIGCGPGIATVDFAEQGFTVIALEPSPESAAIAQRNTVRFPQVTILNTAFEEWESPIDSTALGFDAVIAATSIHWIPAEIAYPKIAQILKPLGGLILLWNMTMQPAPNVFEAFRPVYAEFAPNLGIYETRAIQEQSLAALGEVAIASGYFSDLSTEIMACQKTYSTQNYLDLLSTYSPYLKMPTQERSALFTGLKAVIQREVGDQIDLHYLSAVQVARKQ